MVTTQIDKQKNKELSKVTKEEWREFTKSVWHIANVSDPKHPAVFPEEIPFRLIKLFSFYGETVLDPFAGIGTTAKVANRLGRNAICIDQNTDYVKAIRDIPSATEAEIMAEPADSRNLPFIPSDSISLIITSPPYWNKANYGTGETNLGNIERYDVFLKEIETVFRECYRVLSAGRKICIITANVNQFTEHGLLTFPLAADFTNVLRRIGFMMVKEVIWDKDGTGGKWGSYGHQRPIFGSYPYPPNFLFKTVHEYVLIFAKPNGGKAKGAKVRLLKDIVGTNTAVF